MRQILRAGPFSGRSGEGRILFDRVNVRLETAAFTLLEGPSGGGKSTLLRQLAALEQAPGAERSLSGEPYAPAEMPAWRAQVTLLAQDAPMLPGTVGCNLEFPFALCHCGARTLDEGRRDELLHTVGLEEIPLGRDIGTLSGGERHRLALVRGLLWDPPVLLADEPLTGLDPGMAATCFDLLLAHARRDDRAVLCVLHDPEMGEQADRRLVLSGGRLEGS